MPGVVGVRTGVALPSTRTVADTCFDVAVVISFTDAAALQAYLEHPRHKQELRRMVKPLVRRVLVYDFVE